ncbi:MAG: hypothetical protein ACWIPJ_09025 [Polaribacter sp.]
MVKKNLLVLFFVLLAFFGCSGLFFKKTKSGRPRVNKKRFSIKIRKNNLVYNQIDTNSTYRLVREERKNITGSVAYGFYKFYSKKRVGYYSINEVQKIFDSTKQMDPRYAIMGYFELLDDNNLIIETANYSWHAGLSLIKDTLKIKDNKLILNKVYRNPNASMKSIYQKEVIPENIQGKRI